MDGQLRPPLVRRLLRMPFNLVWRALRPLAIRGRSWVTAPLDAQLIHTTNSLRAAVDAGVVALAARASVLDATVAGGHLGARLDAIEASIATLAARLHTSHTRLDGQQRLIFDGLLEELMPLRTAIDRIEQYSYASARRVAVSSAGDLLVRSEAGYIVCAGSDLSVLASLIETGELERGTRLLIERMLQPGDCFVDVGANIGIHTLAAGRALQRQGAIHAFEPFVATCAQLQKSVWLNGLADITTVHASAVSDRAGTQPLYLGASSGHHSLYKLETAEDAQVVVPTIRLDDVVRQQVTLLKIDAEGAELAVLAGARQVIEHSPDIALIVECGPAHLTRSGHTVDDWLADFSALGLVWRSIDPVSGAVADITPATLAASESTNLLFARPGASCWTRILEHT